MSDRSCYHSQIAPSSFTSFFLPSFPGYSAWKLNMYGRIYTLDSSRNWANVCLCTHSLLTEEALITKIFGRIPLVNLGISFFNHGLLAFPPTGDTAKGLFLNECERREHCTTVVTMRASIRPCPSRSAIPHTGFTAPSSPPPRSLILILHAVSRAAACVLPQVS